MALCEIHYWSNSLTKMTAANVIVPEGIKGPFPVFYLLHGLSDDYSVWCRRTSIERYVADLPLIVVMPDGGRGFYCDGIENPRQACESAIVKDLIGFIDNTFPTIAKREGRVIGGLSMGGYGALKLAVKFPELFCATVSHSGAVTFSHYALNRDDDWDKEFGLIVGENPVGGPNDIFALIQKPRLAPLPAIRIDCGVDDFLIERNREMHAFLKDLGIPHEYEEYPGVHNWAYWDEHVQEAIAFFARALKIKKREQ